MTMAQANPTRSRASWAAFPALLLACGATLAQVPAILIEACSQMEPASKRVECLQAANGVAAPSAVARAPAAPQAAFQQQPAVNSFAAPTARPAARSGTQTTPGGATCYVGPRGGTYTITASGRKNYSGC